MTVTAGSPITLGLEHSFVRKTRDEPRTSDGDGLRLSEKLDCLWEGLLATGVAVCPVCAGRMTRAGADAGCEACGTRLS